MQLRESLRSVARLPAASAALMGIALAGAALAGSAAAQGVPNDNCVGAWPLGLGQTAGTNEGSTKSPGSVSCAPIDSDVWYSLVAPGDGLLKISTVVSTATLGPGDAGSTPPIDSVLTVYSGVCGALVPLACNDDASLFTLQSEVTVFVTAGQPLLLRVGGFLGDTGNFLLTVSLQNGTPAPNDECSGALLVATPTISGSNELAVTDTLAGTCSQGGKNLWYACAAPGTGQMTASLAHSGGSADFDTVLAIYEGACGALQQIACNDDAVGLASEASFAVVPGELYYVSVGGYQGDAGSFTLSLKFEPEAIPPFVEPFSGHTFTLGPAGMTWTQARDHAQALGGHLATFGTFFEALLVQANFATQPTPLWIGLTDEGHEGSFTWVTGEPLVYTSWGSAQPDNDCSGSAENSVAMLPSSGAWVDTTETGCTLGPLRGLIEFEVPIPLASTTSVGAGCAAGTPPALLGDVPVLGGGMALTVLDPGMVSTCVILASLVPPAPTAVGRCTIQVDPTASLIAAELVTDGVGFSTVVLPVPSDAALLGMSLAAQAFLVRVSDHSVAATNGLHVTLGF
jgi:hypothetical protein